MMIIASNPSPPHAGTSISEKDPAARKEGKKKKKRKEKLPEIKKVRERRREKKEKIK
jgi:hypothetical protein